MSIADNKKCQTLTNVVAEELIKLKNIANRLKTFGQTFVDQNVTVINCGLENNIAVLSTWIQTLDACANNTTVSEISTHAVPGHGTKSLGEI